MTAARSDRSGETMPTLGRWSSVRTFCRICEPSCGLVADVDGGDARQADARPRASGHQGLRLPQGPRRGRRPPRPRPPRPPAAASRRRLVDDRRLGRGDGPHRRAGCRRSAAEHGPDAVSAYIGNPTAFNALGLAARRRRCCGRSACAGRSRRARRTAPTSSSPARRCSASSTVHPIPDLEHTDLCLIIGENPRASQASFYSIPNVLGELRRATGRGRPHRVRQPAAHRDARPRRRRHGADPARHRRLVPRRACSTRSTGSAGSTPACIARHGRHVDELRAFLAAYPADRVAAVTGVDADVIARAGGGVGRHAAGVGARLDRAQHGPPGHARLLARAHAVVRHRPPRRRGRQPQERRLLRQRPVRRRRRPSRATSTPSSAGCGAARCPAR